jgi:hypothetical protein
VPPQTVPSVRLPASPKALRARRNISSEALRVNARSMIPARIDPLRHKPGHPRRKSFGLARAGSGNGKNWALACGGGAKLFGVQVVNPGFGHVPSRIRTATPDVQPLREG